jgi:hypothetical protein
MVLTSGTILTFKFTCPGQGIVAGKELGDRGRAELARASGGHISLDACPRSFVPRKRVIPSLPQETHQNFHGLQGSTDSSLANLNPEGAPTSCRVVAMEFAKAASARRLLRWPSPLTRPRSWVGHSCRGSFAVASRRFSSKPPPADKPYYVTTPIFYVNAGMCWMEMDVRLAQHRIC